MKAAKLPTQTPEKMGVDEFIQLMSVDKKVRAGKLYLVLLNKIGEAVLTADFKPSSLEETLRECCSC